MALNLDLEVIVTTWGSDEWNERGRVAAKYNSGWHYHEHDDVSAGEARNRAVRDVDPQNWICFLDADDELGDGYYDAMEAAVRHERELLTPALALGDRPSECYTERDIINGLNPCPIGTLIHRSVFDEVGGFWDEPAWEDWSLFRRAVLVGADIVFVPGAIYHAAANPNGRNSTIANTRRLRQQILDSHRRWTP